MTPQVLHFPSHPQAITLRDYQQRGVEELRAAMMRSRRVVRQLPVGGGKTIEASRITQMAVAKGKRVLALAHTRELVDQYADKLSRFGVACGIIMAGREPNWSMVQVASKDTVHSRAFRSDKLKLDPPDLIVLDECHRSITRTWTDVLNAFPEAFVLGLTATPCRGDGRGLGEIYGELVTGPTCRELTESGYLVPMRYFAPKGPDLTGVGTNRDGDYIVKRLGKAMDKPKLIGDMVEHWCLNAAGLSTLVFTPDVKSAMHAAEEFKREGVPAAHVNGETPADEREKILASLESGELKVVANCMVLTEGFDKPRVSCIVLFRPTKSERLFIQIVGRGLRSHPGKTECVVLDHAGCHEQFEFIEPWETDHVVFGEVPWSLDGSEKVKERIAKDKKPKLQIVCSQCHRMYSGRRNCPECGAEAPKRQPKPAEWEDGQLAQIRGSARMKDKARVLAELKGYALEKGFKNGWAMHSYRRIFGVWPHSSIKLCRWTTPSEEVRGWAIADWRARRRKLKPRKAAEL